MDQGDGDYDSPMRKWDQRFPEIFPRSTLGHLNWLLWDFVAALHDVLLPSPRVTHSPSDIDGLTDEEIVNIAEQILGNDSNDSNSYASDGSTSDNAWRITQNSVLKQSSAQDIHSEVIALELVARQTNIPVPFVRRTLEVESDEGRTEDAFVMEHIPGRNLDVVWPQLGWFARLKVVFTVRSYIRQLRRVRVPRGSVPGPLREPGKPAVKSDMPLWGDIRPVRGPFSSYASLLEFLNDRNELAIELRDENNSHMVPSSYYPIPIQAAFDDTFPLVLCHMDISPRNFILDERGVLWLIDFGCAGMWPTWFEYVAMRRDCEDPYHDESDPSMRLQWRALVPFMAGRFWDQEILFDRTSVALTYR